MKKVNVFAYSLKVFDPKGMKSEIHLVNRFRGEYFETPEAALEGAKCRINESDGEFDFRDYALTGKAVTEKSVFGGEYQVWVETPVTITPQIIFIEE